MHHTTSADAAEADLRRLRIVGIVAPVAFLLCLQIVRAWVIEPAWPDHDHVIVGAIGLTAAALFGVVIFIRLDRAYRLVTAANQEAATCQATVLERDRLARELHDSLAQVLAVTRLRLAALAGTPDLKPPVRTELNDLSELCRDAYADVRETITGLREARAADRDLLDILAAYIDKYERTSGVPTTFTANLEPQPQLAPIAELQVVRVVQEALSNVRKHARATSASVTVSRVDGTLRFTVADDGHGFAAPADAPGFGLQSMRERAAQVGGTLHVDSTPGAGTRITVEVPEEAVA